MKAEGEIKFEGKIRIHFRYVKYDGVIQSINEDVLNTPGTGPGLVLGL